MSAPPRAPRLWLARVALLEVILEVPACASHPVGLSPEGAAALEALVEDLMALALQAGATPVAVSDLALLLAWEVSGERLSAALERAVACASCMAGVLRVGRPGLDQPVAMRAGLVGGQISLGAYGGLAGRWIPVLCGQPLLELGSLAALCGAGEAAVGAAAAAAWLEHPAGREGASHQLLLTLGAPERACRPQQGERLQAPLNSQGSVAVVELLGLDPGRDDQPRRLQAAVRALQRVARLHGGELEAVRQDHRGLCGWIWFGVGEGTPLKAALGALRFGLDVGPELADLGIEAPVGVASGEILSWESRSTVARVRVGAAVNRAARQVRASASEVVCDSQTARWVGSAATLVELTLHTAEGGADGHRFRVERVRRPPRVRDGSSADLVGRGEDLARAELVLEEFEAGGAAALVLEGAQGMGKTLLMTTLGERIAKKPWIVAKVTGSAGPAAEPRIRWRDALLQGLGIAADTPRGELEARLGTQLGTVGTQLASSALAAVLLPSSTSVCEPSGQDFSVTALAQEVAALLGVRPFCLFVEDAQWLEPASWCLMRELVDSVERLLLVIAVRTEASAGAVERQRLEVAPEATIVSLRSLSPTALSRLIGRGLGGCIPPKELVSWLARASGGNPGLCLEWLRLLRDERILEVMEGRTVVFHEERIEAAVPVGPGPLLTRRIARLPPGVLRTLAVARRVGSPFSVELMVAAHPDQPGRLRVECDLEQLRTEGLLRVARGVHGDTWRLVQEIPGRNWAEVFDRDTVRALHERAATFIQSESDELGQIYATLAHHWRAAGNEARAIAFLELAGAEAQRVGAMQEACQHFQLALRIADSQPGLSTDTIRRAHWERSLGEARYACGELERCSVNFHRALSALDRPFPRTRGAVVADALWQALRWIFSRPLSHAAAGLEAGELSRLHEASHVAERLAERYYYSANLLEMVAVSLRSANLARRMGRRGRNGRPFSSFGVIVGLAGFTRYARRLHEHALRVGREARDPAGITVALYTRAAYHVGQGEWREGVALADEAVAEAEAAAAWQEGGVAHTTQGLAFYFQGAYTAAEASYLALLERARRYDNAQHEAWALLGIGQAQLQTGRLHEAVRSVLKALAVLRQLDDYPSRLICQGVLASSYLRQERHEEALEAAELAWSAARQVAWPFVLSTLDGYLGAAEVFLAAWQREQSGGREFPMLALRARRAIRLLGRFARIFPFGRPHWLLARGLAAALEGHPQRARALGQRAMKLATELGMTPQAGAAQALLARYGGYPTDERAALEASAAESFSSTGCLWHLEELRRWSGALQQGQSQ